MSTVLEVIDVHRRFGQVQALAGVTFRVPDGKVVGFVGRNGAGKTTTMRVICGVVAQDSGEVRWEDRPIDRAMRSRIGYLPEERGLYPKMPVGRQLDYLAEISGVPRGEARRRRDELVERLGLGAKVDAPVESLSLGNQQRVQLAAALIHRPALLVLDEPFSGLDPVGVDVMADVLLAEVARGVGVLFSSHQLELVERLCDEVVIVEAGRVVRTGSARSVGAPEAGAAPRWRVEVAGAGSAWVAAVAGTTLVEADGDVAVVELPEGADEQALLDAARRAGPVRAFAAVEVSLADVFRTVVSS